MPQFRYEAYRDPYAGSIGELLARRGDIEANRAMQVAAIQAQAQQARGQAWGNAVQGIGQSLAGTIGRYQQDKQEAPIRAQQLEAGRINLENARTAQATQRQGAEDAGIMRSAMSSRMSPDEVKAQLAELGRGDLIPAFDETWSHLETSRLNLKALKEKTAEAEADYLGGFGAGLIKAKFDPLAVEWSFQEAERDGHDVTEYRNLWKTNPQGFQTIAASLVEKSPTQRKLAGEEADRALKTQQEQRAITTQQQAEADRQVDNSRQAEAGTEAARHNRATEARAAAGASDITALTPQGLDMAALRYKTTGIMPALGMGDKTTRQKIINRSAELTDADAQRIEAGGGNIAANAANYRADSGSLTAMQKQRDAITSFEKTASKNIDIFLEQAGKVVDTGSPLMNTPVRMFTGKVAGSPDQAAYDAARQVAINEVAKITSNPNMSGVLSDSARKEVEAFNPREATLKQTVAVMRILKQDMANRTLALDETLAATRERLKGTPPTATGTIRATDPQGNIHEAPAGTVLPKGWVLQ